MTVEMNDSLSNRGLLANKVNKVKTLQFQIDAARAAYAAGSTAYDPVLKTFVDDTGFPDVRTTRGREVHILVYNGSGAGLSNGDPASATGESVSDVPSVTLTISTNVLIVLGFVGVCTMDIPDGEFGIVTTLGEVHDVPTAALEKGFIYVNETGGYTNERPRFPLYRLVIGGIIKTGVADGILYISPKYIPRRSASRGSSFTSADAGAGTHYRNGFYDWSATAATLSNASPTVTYGPADVSRAGHVGIVPSGPGTVDTGQVGIQVTGTLDSEDGPQQAAQTLVINDDITTLTLNEMEETVGKFSGTVTLEPYVVSGTPTAYSLTFNYGYSKYEDFINTDGTVVGFEAVWEAGAADSAYNVTLFHHKKEGWIYAASGFEPGSDVICDRLTDQGINSDLAIGVSGSWKRSNLNTFIEASKNEGGVIRIITGSPNTIRSSDMTTVAFSEDLR